MLGVDLADLDQVRYRLQYLLDTHDGLCQTNAIYEKESTDALLDIERVCGGPGRTNVTTPRELEPLYNQVPLQTRSLQALEDQHSIS